MDRDELAPWLRLALTDAVGPASARRLLAAFGLPQHIFCQSQQALADVIGPARARALATEPQGLATQLELTTAWLGQEAPAGTRGILTLADPQYPAGLLNTEDPPLLLYFAGQLPAAWPAALAVVGSRNPTPQGATNAQVFARGLAQAGLTVVSGLALGVDGAAHEGALDGAAPGQLATVAVVGTGLDRVYPRQHLDLAHRIAQRGLLVSEYPLGTPPLAENFPRRNRIISALSQGTLVVEAAMRSGSLITARMALEQGRDVFAIPGSIHSPQSRGCHALLKQGAKLVETVQDVLEDLGGLAPALNPVAAQPQERSRDGLLEALGHDPAGLDELVARTGMAPSQLQARLLELELLGRVARLPGGLYQQVATA